jgi:hypothetical protein
MPHTMLIVFADHHMPDAVWEDLCLALRRGQPEVVTAMPALAGQRVEIIRGDRVLRVCSWNP